MKPKEIIDIEYEEIEIPKYKVKPIGFMFAIELVGVFVATIIYPPYSSIVILIYALLHWINPNVKAEVIVNNQIKTMEIRGQKSDDFIYNRIRAVIIALTCLFVTFIYYVAKA